MAMRTPKNEEEMNRLLGMIDMADEETLQNKIEEIGGTEEAINAFLKKQILKIQEKHIPINEMFSYGINGNCIHLHLPVDLHPMIFDKGISRTMDTVNLYLLDAMERIKSLRDSGYYKFQDKDSIYMMSPILKGKRILGFLDELDFKRRFYREKELNNEDFLKNHSEAMLARKIFPERDYVGVAEITFDKMASQEWQDKKQKVVQELKNKGISLEKEKEEK